MLLENVNLEIDRNGYYRYNNDQYDEQWRYLSSSTPDNIKHNSIYDSDDDSNDNKGSHKEVDHDFTRYALVLTFDSKTAATFNCQAGYYVNTLHRCFKRAQATDVDNAPFNS